MKKRKKEWQPENLYYCGLIFLAAAVLLFFAYHIVGLPLEKFLLPCLIHKVTGLYCPGCGGTRAVFCLLKGDLNSSFHYHMLVPCAAFFYLCYMISNTIQYLSGGKIKIGIRYHSFYVKTAIILLILQTLWKNIALLIFHQTL